MENSEKRARITVFSDYVCPFCYLEEPDLARVKREYGDRVEVDWRAYELRPDPVPTLDPDGDYLHRVWNASVYPMAEALGMKLRLPPVQPRSRKALEAAEFAREQGSYDEMHTALFRAFFEDGRDIGDVEVIVDVAAPVGLDLDDLRDALAEGRYIAKVLADEELSRELGVSSVPTMLVAPAGAELSEAEVITGAQPYGGRIEAAVERALGRGR
ncbi:DsbA family oxidoreductase [Rubrobacter marinus]|uniref:DsbA family oxidoreductase n=1 Tax=Rubrobacter marinus TaxID=2653852 RepID=A0A6G8Q1J1_9ACTN|nr:DsbA family protein [Rubrobacter marinus]QIN80318.1 DsbA family oxidoreductase [Rubrobacter marinus]